MPNARLYKLKTNPVEALQFTGTNEREFCSWLGSSNVLLGAESYGAILKIYIPHRAGWVVLPPSGWVIKRPSDGYHILQIYSDSDFKDLYEEIDARMGLRVPPATIDHSLDALERGNNGR